MCVLIRSHLLPPGPRFVGPFLFRVSLVMGWPRVSLRWSAARGFWWVGWWPGDMMGPGSAVMSVEGVGWCRGSCSRENKPHARNLLPPFFHQPLA